MIRHLITFEQRSEYSTIPHSVGMLAGAKSHRRPRQAGRAHRRARGPACSRRFKSCQRRYQLYAALSSCGKTRCKRQCFYEVEQVVIDYTFGHDEIAQRVVERDNATPTPNVISDTTHVFGHDGHGSVRVLYDLAGTVANIAQAFTFAAYGEMIALHNATAQSIAVTERLSSLGYSGEHFDAKAAQQYLRARFYNPANGRFNRLDPFAGNMNDPQSLHKYTYVHGDPIQGIDPTGENLIGTIGAIGIRMVIGGLSGAAIGAATGGAIGCIDAALGNASCKSGAIQAQNGERSSAAALEDSPRLQPSHFRRL